MKRRFGELYQDDNLSDNDVAYKEENFDPNSPTSTTEFITRRFLQTTVQSRNEKRKRMETNVTNKNNNDEQQARIRSPFVLNEKCSTANVACEIESVLPLKTWSSMSTKDTDALNSKEDAQKMINSNSGALYWRAYCKNRKKMLETRQESQYSNIILHPSQYLQASMSQGDGPSLMDID